MKGNPSSCRLKSLRPSNFRKCLKRLQKKRRRLHQPLQKILSQKLCLKQFQLLSRSQLLLRCQLKKRRRQSNLQQKSVRQPMMTHQSSKHQLSSLPQNNQRKLLQLSNQFQKRLKHPKKSLNQLLDQKYWLLNRWQYHKRLKTKNLMKNQLNQSPKRKKRSKQSPPKRLELRPLDRAAATCSQRSLPQ